VQLVELVISSVSFPSTLCVDSLAGVDNVTTLHLRVDALELLLHTVINEIISLIINLLIHVCSIFEINLFLFFALDVIGLLDFFFSV